MSDQDQDKTEQPVKLVHYTTAEAAYSILSKGELWMRKASLMNDFKEASFFIDIMHKLQRHQKEFLHSNKTPKEYKERYKEEIEKDETIQECLKRRGETYGENTLQEILSENERQIKNVPNISGKIKLFTELECCDSCSDVIAQFLERHTNIEIEIIHNNNIRIK